jgi:hypothetical protein
MCHRKSALGFDPKKTFGLRSEGSARCAVESWGQQGRYALKASGGDQRRGGGRRRAVHPCAGRRALPGRGPEAVPRSRRLRRGADAALAPCRSSRAAAAATWRSRPREEKAGALSVRRPQMTPCAASASRCAGASCAAPSRPSRQPSPHLPLVKTTQHVSMHARPLHHARRCTRRSVRPCAPTRRRAAAGALRCAEPAMSMPACGCRPQRSPGLEGTAGAGNAVAGRGRRVAGLGVVLARLQLQDGCQR